MLAQITMSAQVFKSALAISKDKIMPLRKCVNSDLLRVRKIAMPWYKDIFGVQTEYVVTYYPSDIAVLFDGYCTCNGKILLCYISPDRIIRAADSVLDVTEALQKALTDLGVINDLFPAEFKYGQHINMLHLEEYLERYEPHRYKQLKAMEHEKWVMLKSSVGIK